MHEPVRLLRKVLVRPLLAQAGFEHGEIAIVLGMAGVPPEIDDAELGRGEKPRDEPVEVRRIKASELVAELERRDRATANDPESLGDLIGHSGLGHVLQNCTRC